MSARIVEGIRALLQSLRGEAGRSLVRAMKPVWINGAQVIEVQQKEAKPHQPKAVDCFLH